MDVKCAFLYGKIKEEVYVCQPLEFKDPNFLDRVYKVKKELYGLHQAPRAWYETLSTYLLDNGFQSGKIDKTLFIKRHKGGILLAQIYVDHIIFGSTRKDLHNALERKPTRKVTQVPQPSDPKEHVADKVVHKELGDSLVRAATTASSLEVEQDSGNINRTQSKATPNESSSQRTSSGGGPRCQEAIGDTISQTRFENVSKQSNDSLLEREKTKATQANEISILKRRVKKLEKKNRSRTYKLKILYKVGLTARVESLDEQILGEDASKQERRIDDIDADEDITLVSVYEDADKDLGGEEVFVKQEVVTDKEKIDEVTFAQALIELKTSNLKKRRNFFTAKRAEDKRNKPPTQAQQRKIMCTYIKNVEGKKLNDLKNKSFNSIQKMFDRAFKRVNTFVDFQTELVEGSSKRAEEELIQEITKKQKVEDDKEIAEIKKLIEIILDEEEVAIDAISLAVKSPRIVNWKIYKEGKMSYYQIARADGKS
uniref:Ribonuclease H-like domain-containing protein n=1 Tax=Tanacetum cinerariifolium TaxID=118510 RepID=A0A699GPR0_TANCI|nr:ribonuclease H-like domain-containing protein [Tanacetum cinerariifolium]